MAEIGTAQKNRSKEGLKKPNISNGQPDNKSKIQKSSPTKTGDSKVKQPSSTKKTYSQHGVYGGSSSAAKSRRCGECEG